MAGPRIGNWEEKDIRAALPEGLRGSDGRAQDEGNSLRRCLPGQGEGRGDAGYLAHCRTDTHGGAVPAALILTRAGYLAHLPH